MKYYMQRALTIFMLTSASLCLAALPKSKANVSTKYLCIKWRNDGYYERNTRIWKKTVDNLIDAIQWPYRERRIFLHHRWLENNVSLAIDEYNQKIAPNELLPEQEELFKKAFHRYSFTDSSLVPYRPTAEEAENTFNITATIQSESGDYIHISSQNPYPVLLPWKVQRGDRSILVYDTKMSRAIHDCFQQMGVKMVQSDRFVRAYITNDLVNHELNQQMEALGLIKNLMDRFSPDNKRLQLIGRALYPRHRRCREQEYVPTIHADFRSKQLPQNVRIDLTCKLAEDELDIFVNASSRHLDRILLNKHLKKLIADNPQSTFKLSFSNGRNLNPASRTRFVSCFEERYGGNRVNEARSLFDGSTLIIILEKGNRSFSRWLLEKNGRMFLWCNKGSCILGKPSKHYSPNERGLALRSIPWSKFEEPAGKEESKSRSSWFGL